MLGKRGRQRERKDAGAMGELLRRAVCGLAEEA